MLIYIVIYVIMAEASNVSSGAANTTGRAPGTSCGSKPICVICIGMAGTGKTTFVQRLTAHLHSNKCPPYVINLDPAVQHLPYPANIDIRDTVDYKQVMAQYGLGPNGGIVTSLNLFATRFDQVMGFIEKRAPECKYVLLDTPGQIEVFTWSASGSIITETLASVFPTVVVYIMDTVRCVNPVTFMSNMLYACSILYKTKLPFIVVMNKVDITDHKFAIDWMKDFEVFQESLDQETSYASSLSRSMSLVLDEFYENLTTVGVSSLDGLGIDGFLKAVDAARVEYEQDYLPQLERMKKRKDEETAAKREEQLERLKKDRAEGEVVDINLPSAAGSADQQPRRGIEINLMADSEDSDDIAMDDSDGDQQQASFRTFLHKQKPSRQDSEHNMDD